MSYEDTLGQLIDGLTRILKQLWEAVGREELKQDDFRVLSAQIIAGTNAQAFTMGELSVRAYIEAETGIPTPIPSAPFAPAAPSAPAPAAHFVDLDRLERAVSTIADSDLDTPMQLERIAAGEPAEAAARGAVDAMQRAELVSGWKRGLEADACELCVWWWREGRIWQPDHVMPRHTGCQCQIVPVVDVAAGDNQQTRNQAAGAAATRRRRGMAAA